MRKSRYGILSFLLVLTLLVGMLSFLPAAAGAAQIVGSLDFVNVITSDSSGDGWVWTQSTHTLALDGIDLTCPASGAGACAILLPGDSTITLSGDNVVARTAAGGLGVIEAAGNLKVEGVGTLTITGSTPGISTYGLSASPGSGNLVIDSGTVTITSSGSGLGSGMGDVVISGTAVVNISSMSSFNGISTAGGDVIFSGGTTVLTTHQGSGILTTAFTNVVFSGGDVTINAAKFGINVLGSVTISGGTVHINAVSDPAVISDGLALTGGQGTIKTSSTSGTPLAVRAWNPPGISVDSSVWVKGWNEGDADYTRPTAIDFVSGGSSSYDTFADAETMSNQPPTRFAGIQWGTLTSGQYTVTYSEGTATSGTVPVDPNSYSLEASVTVLGNPGNLAKDGYTFAGWTDGDDTYQEGETFTLTGDTVFEPVWAANYQDPYWKHVSYDGNANTSGSVPTDAVHYEPGDEATVKSPGDLAKFGYTFASWTDGDNTYQEGDRFTINADTTLTALWEPDYTSSYWKRVFYLDVTPHTGTPPTDSTYYGTGQTVTVRDQNTLDRFGYTFIGWTDGLRFFSEGDTFTIRYNTVLFAVWIPDYTSAYWLHVTYDGNDNTSGTAPTDATHYRPGRRVTVQGPGDLAKFGYTFAGWTDGDNTYQEGDRFTINADTTLTALWEPDYTSSYWKRVTYEGNGNTSGSAPTDPTYYEVGQTVIVLDKGDMVRKGYTFIGWSYGEVVYKPGDTFEIEDDATLVALWERNPVDKPDKKPGSDKDSADVGTGDASVPLVWLIVLTCGMSLILVAAVLRRRGQERYGAF